MTALAVTALVCLQGCAADPVEAEVGMRVQWFTGEPTAELPADLETLRLLLYVEGEDAYTDTFLTVQRLPTDPTGRPYSDTPFLRSLPVGREIRLEVEGYRPGMSLGYFGQTGPFVLREGERRYVDLNMYELSIANALDAGTVGARVMHTTTALPDGRVLIAGGFDQIENDAPCPDTAPPGARCVGLVASTDAFLYDPTSATFHPVQWSMLEARGGHTATLLGDGRVLMAGGAATAVLAIVIDGAGAITYEPLFLTEEPSATFEVFLPDTPTENADVDRDGDAGRGSFIGSAEDPATVGMLNDRRFLHAAARIEDLVVLAGGVASPGTFEVYDDVQPGGYGVLPNDDARLGVARTMPTAAVLGGAVWILGGARASGNDDLADVWTPAATGNGSIAPASSATRFPNPTDDDDLRPELSWLRPSVAGLSAGEDLLVVGWLGPRCIPGMTTPSFDPAATDLCGVGNDRSVVIEGAAGRTVTQTFDQPHAFAAAATLSSGRVVVTGGLRTSAWQRSDFVEVFTGVVIDGVAEPASDLALRDERAFHTTTALPNDGALTLGGLTFSADVQTATLVDGVEVLYLPRTSIP
jgi:hypothetical protein